MHRTKFSVSSPSIAAKLESREGCIATVTSVIAGDENVCNPITDGINDQALLLSMRCVRAQFFLA